MSLVGLYQWSTGKVVSIGVPFDYLTYYQDQIEEDIATNATVRSQLFHHGIMDLVSEPHEEDIDPCFILATFQIASLSSQELQVMEKHASHFDPRKRDAEDPMLDISFDVVSTSCKFQIQGTRTGPRWFLLGMMFLTVTGDCRRGHVDSFARVL